jgi:hypothetical protein
MTGAVSGRDGLTASFLTRALGPHLGDVTVTAVRAEPVGTGQVSDSFRLHLSYDGPVRLPPTLIAKVPAADPASRGAARAFRTYEIEACFYAEVAPALPEVSLAGCFFSAYDSEPDEYIVLLADLAPAQPGDQLAGLPPADAALAVDELAALHAAGWQSDSLAALSWLNRSGPEASALMASAVEQLYPGFRDRYAGRLEPGTLPLLEAFVPQVGRYVAVRDEPRTIVHGDFRADNLLFGHARPVVLDWQTASFGSATGDLSYFLASSLPVDVRREHEEALVRRYHAALSRRGVPLSWPECWDGYRRSAFGGLVMDIIASMVVQRTDRGDEMFAAMANRHAWHARDLGSLDTLR